jgi:tetratricopeptide (TPR) repeat protein
MVLATHEYQAEGLRCLAEAERLDPREVRWPYFQGVLLLRDDPDAGLPKLQRAAELAPTGTESPRLRLAQALLARGRWDEAQGLFSRVLAQDPDNAPARLGLGQVAYEQGRLEDSLAYLRDCTDNPVTGRKAHTLLAEIYQQQGNGSAATRELSLAERAPTHFAWPDPLYLELEDLRVGVRADVKRGTNLLVEGKVSEALALLEDTVRKYPEVDYAWVAYGRALVSADDFETAEGAFRRALHLAPNMAEAHFYLGVSLYQQKKRPAAEVEFRRATELQPADAWAHYNLGQCLKEEGKRALAIDAFRAAARARPQFAEAHRDLGELLAQAGQDAEALAELRQAVDLAPDDTAAQKLLEQVRNKGGNPASP